MSDIVERLSERRRGFGQMVHENVDELPGLYSFWVRDKCLYVGMSTNLRQRLKQHCEYEDNSELSEYFDAYNGEIMMSFVYEENASERKLRELESKAIKQMAPIANKQGLPR